MFVFAHPFYVPVDDNLFADPAMIRFDPIPYSHGIIWHAVSLHSSPQAPLAAPPSSVDPVVHFLPPSCLPFPTLTSSLSLLFPVSSPCLPSPTSSSPPLPTMLARASVRAATTLLRSAGGSPVGRPARPAAATLRRTAAAAAAAAKSAASGGAARRAVPAAAAASAAATATGATGNPPAAAPAPAAAAATTAPPSPPASVAGLAAIVTTAATATVGRGWLLACGVGLDDDGV